METQYIICVTKLEQNVKEKRTYVQRGKTQLLKTSINILVYTFLIYTITNNYHSMIVVSTHYTEEPVLRGYLDYYI